MANLLKWLGNAIGTAADAVIPGDQSSWHNAPAPTPTPPAGRTPAPTLALPTFNTGGLPQFAPPGVAPLATPKPVTPTTPGDLIDYINTMAKLGPKAVQAPRVTPDNVQQEDGVQGTLQALGQIPLLGIPVQIGNQINDMNNTAIANMKNGIPQYTPGAVLGGAAATGVANSPLGQAGQLFGDVANEFTKRAGLGDGTTSSQDNPLFGDTSAISNQVADKGLARTALDTGMNVLGAAGAAGKTGEVGGPTIGEAAQSVRLGNKAVGEGGFLAGPKATGYQGAKATDKVIPAPDGKPRFEISDANAKYKGPGETLGQVLDHPALFEQYPELKHMPVKEENMEPGYLGGYSSNDNTLTLNRGMPDSEKLSTIIHEVQHAIQDHEGFAPGGTLRSAHPDFPEFFKLQQQLKPLVLKLEAQPESAGKDRLLSELYDGPAFQKLVELDAKMNFQTRIAPGKYVAGYKALHGEAEARAVQKRAHLPQEDLPHMPSPYHERYTGFRPNDLVIRDRVDDGVSALHEAVSPAAQKLADRSKANDAPFQASIAKIAKDMGLNHIAGPPKLAGRIHEKSVNDYGGDVSQVQDGVRATLTVPDPAQAQAIHDALAKQYGINRYKNDFDKEGYKDAKVNVKLKDGTLAEVQITTPEMLAAKKEGGGHKMYKEARSTTNKDRLNELEAQMKTLYDAAWSKTQARLRASAADISRPSTTTRAGATRLPVETTTPDTVSPLVSRRTTVPSTSKNLDLPVTNTIGSSPFNSTIAQKASEVKTNKVVDTAYKQTVANGGVTINLKGKQPSGGLAFSPYKDTEHVVDKADFTPQVVDDYMKAHADKLAQPGNHLGLWEDGGKIYLDISQVGDKSAATLQKAIDAKQLAAFDLGSFEEVPLGKMDEKGYTALHEAAHHPYLDGGQDSGAGAPGASGKLAKVPGNEIPDIPRQAHTPEPPTGRVASDSGKTTRYAGTTIPKSEKVSEPIREQVKAEAPKYTVAPEAEGLKRSADLIDRLGPDGAHEDVLKRLDVKPGHIGRQDVIDGQAVAAGLDARGGDVAHRMAADIYKKLSTHLTALGQTVQAAAMMARRTPEGLKYQALSDLRKAGVDITPELEAKINQHIDDIKNTPAGEGRGRKVAELSKTVQKAMPKGAAENLISVWKAGLLSGVKTQGGNFLSNSVFGVMNKLSDVGATGIDKAFSLGTGERTKAFSLKTDHGIREGVAKGFDTLKTGIDSRDIGPDGKYQEHGEINFKNKLIQKYVGQPSNLVFRGMNAADQPFYFARFRDTLHELGKVDGINAGLHGSELTAHAAEFAKNPTEGAVQTATNSAKYAVLAQDTKVGAAVADFARKIPGGQVLAPFTKVPTNFITETLDYTPAGAIKEIAHQAKAGNFDQRAMSEALSKAGTGTAVIYLGTQLALGGRLSGDYPTSNQHEQERWKAEKIQPNSVKIGGTWVNLNYFGPVGLLFNAGKAITDASAQGGGALAQVAAAAGGLGQGLLGQSFLQGFSGFGDAIKDPGRYGENFIKNEAGSVIPAISNDVANIMDTMQRQSNSVLDSVKARIPGVRNTLNPKVTSLGDPVSQPSGDNFAGSLNAALNPLKPSTQVDNPLFSEINRLHDAKQDVFPISAKTIGQGPTLIKLDGDQQMQHSQMVGDAVKPLWNSIIASPAYQKLDDPHKATVLTNALSDATSAVNRQMTSQIDSTKLTKPATGVTAQILMGNVPTATDYLTKGQTAQDKANGVTPAKPAVAKKTTAKKASTKVKGVSKSLPRMPTAKAFNARSANSAITKLLSTTGKGFHTPKIAKAKIPKTRKRIA